MTDSDKDISPRWTGRRIKSTVKVDSHLVVSVDIYCIFGHNQFPELIHGRPSMVPASYVLKYAHIPWNQKRK